MPVGNSETNGYEGCFFIAPYATSAFPSPVNDVDAMLGSTASPVTDIATYFAGTAPTPASNVYTDPYATNFPQNLLLTGGSTGLKRLNEYKKLGCVQNFDLSNSQNSQEISCFGDREVRYVPGQPSFDISIEVLADVRARSIIGPPNSLRDPGHTCLLAAWCRQDKIRWYFLPDDLANNPFMIAGVGLLDNFNWSAPAESFQSYSIDFKAFAIIKGEPGASPTP